MAHWTPKSDEPVGKQKYVARRLFDEPLLAGVEGQKKKPSYEGLSLRHFEEKRDKEATRFSLQNYERHDRIGWTRIDRVDEGWTSRGTKAL